jgi:hypothetical protein
VLSGAVTVRQLAENLGGERVRLDSDDVLELTERPEDPDRYWADRSARPWT